MNYRFLFLVTLVLFSEISLANFERATVTAPNAMIKKAPGEYSINIRPAVPEERGKVIGKEGSWLHISFKNNQEGWLSGESVRVDVVAEPDASKPRLSTIKLSDPKEKGFKSIPWGETETKVLEALPAKGTNLTCDLNDAKTREIFDAVTSIKNDSAFGQILTPIRYESSPRYEAAARFYSIKRTSTGCSIFFDNKFVAQINSVQKKLAERDLLQALEATFGPATPIREPDPTPTTKVGWYRVHELQNEGTQVYLLFNKENVITAYVSKTHAALIPNETLWLLQDNEKNQAAETKLRKRNTKRIVKDL